MGISETRKTRLAGIEGPVDFARPAIMAFEPCRRTTDIENIGVSEISSHQGYLQDQENAAADMDGLLGHRRKVATGNKRCNAFCLMNNIEIKRKTTSSRSRSFDVFPHTLAKLMSAKNDYRLIACSIYDLFEAAALHRRTLHRSIGRTTSEHIIQDVYSKGNEEFLKVSRPSTCEEMTVRLHKIDLIVDPADKKSYVPYHC